jgi:CHAT domain-containing protein
VTDRSGRPGLRLLGSLVAEERVGRPGAARAEALAAARADPGNAHVHLLDAACAALVAGEPRAAAPLLKECETHAPRDEAWPRRIAAVRAWIWSLDWNRYPGETGAELPRADSPPIPADLPGDPETRLLEAVANAAATLLNVRATVAYTVRENPALAQELAGGAAGSMQRLASALESGGAHAAAAGLAFADLQRRARQHEEAEATLAIVRSDLERLSDEAAYRPMLANTYLVEGDWFATPGSSPEALGFDLPTLNVASPFLALRDPARAAAAYDQAGALLVGVDEPRMHGMLELRRATLSWLAADHEAQLGFVEAAGRAFEAAGDVAPGWVVTIHRLLAQLGAGKVATVRLAAGSGFDAEPRGVAAELLRWARADGSVSWATGLGRLLQRAATAWDGQDDPVRAAVAYEVAAPIVTASGVESESTVTLSLATVEQRSGIGVRALSRCRRQLASLPPISDAARESLEWSRSLDVVLTLVQGYQAAAATAAGADPSALEWALERAQELLQLPGVPPPGSGQGLDLETIGRAMAEQTVAERLTPLAGDVGFQLRARQADTAREIAGFADAFASLQRGRQAAAIGATETADHWYGDALTKLAALPGEYTGLAVVVWAARDRFDEARRQLRAILDRPGQRPDFLATLAVRARDYETALRLFEQLDSNRLPWADLLDYGEAALGAGRAELAVSLTEAAVAGFEQHFAHLARDVDRISALDDVKVSALYLAGARAHLAHTAELGGPERESAERRAFELSDRGRALALEALLADASDLTDNPRLITEWRRVSSEWEAAYERLLRSYATRADDAEVLNRISAVGESEDRLVRIEARLEASRVGRSRPARTTPPGLVEIQAALPPDAVLLEYQLVDRDLLLWTVTRTTADAVTSTRPTGEIARLAKAVQRGCANGRPAGEAAELAAILLEPAAHVLDGVHRVIVVPYGALHGLPFHALPLGGRALGESHVLSYVQAAALLAHGGVDQPLALHGALVVGDPAFDEAAHPSLRRLPGAGVEAAAVARTHRARPLIGADATEEAVRRALAAADVIHLAAHGRLDPIAPSDSSIILARRDELTVSDLVGLRIDAQLAVLSACDSGRGPASLGGDVVGLARGLFAAGARRSVVSLWPVDDAPACVTMSLLHERLAAGLPVATALHQAQAAVRALSAAELAAQYVELGGDAAHTVATRRRGAPTAELAPKLELVEDFVDNLDDAEPIDTLSGDVDRVWAPFVVLGV